MPTVDPDAASPTSNTVGSKRSVQRSPGGAFLAVPYGRRLLAACCCALFLACAPLWALDADGRLPAPVPATASEILAATSAQTRVYALPSRQPILLIDFPSLAEQGRMFNRIVAMIERLGLSRTRVLDDHELAQFIRSTGKSETTFAYGNDILVSEFVVFFNLAEHAAIPLNAEERALRQLLIDQGLIRERFGFLQAVRPNAVVLSVPQEQPAGGGEPPVSRLARETILTHELAHAEYYTNPLYRAWCWKFWREAMSEPQRQKMRAFLAKSGYDPENEELMVNENHAYLFYTPDPRAFNPKLVGFTEREMHELWLSFFGGFPDAPPTVRR